MAQADPYRQKMSMEKLSVHGFAFGGESVGRLENGKVCFLRGGIPGEELSVRITSEKKSYCRGELLEILQRSPFRLQEDDLPCPLGCPGCSYTHIPYALELEWKEKIFRSFAEKARLEYASAGEFLLAATGAGKVDSYRNKIRLSLEFPHGKESVRAGYRGEDNVTLLEISDCPLAHPAIRETLRSGIWKETLCGTEKSVTFRRTEKDGCVFFFDKGDPSHILTETLGDHGEFRVAENAFFQVNSFMSGVLAQKVADYVKKTDCTFMTELYCGCGCFSIVSAQQQESLHCLGIELENSSVKLAGENAIAHSVADRCSFLAGDSAKVFRRNFPRGLKKNSLLLVDPPRTGMDQKAVKLVAESNADFLIYVSCSPDTLFRDLVTLEKYGAYRVRESSVVDLFPRTGHFESITFCERIS